MSEKHLPDTTDKLRRSSASRPHLDPKVKAQLRRDRGCTAQRWWDESLDASAMLNKLRERDGLQPSQLLPPAKFMEVAHKRYVADGGRADTTIWRQTMTTCGRFLISGRFDQAVLWLRHAYSGTFGLKPDQVLRAMADVVREFFPCSPEPTDAPTPVYGESLLQKALPVWRDVQMIEGSAPGSTLRAHEPDPDDPPRMPW